jgi:hypothetical protein
VDIEIICIAVADAHRAEEHAAERKPERRLARARIPCAFLTTAMPLA